MGWCKPRVAVMDFDNKTHYSAIVDIRLTEVDSSYAEGNAISGSGFKVGDIVE
jgi:hypothetical protein